MVSPWRTLVAGGEQLYQPGGKLEFRNDFLQLKPKKLSLWTE